MSFRAQDYQSDLETAHSEEPARDIPAIFAGNLKRLRKANGYSLDRLAELSRVSRAMLGQIETGKSVPTIVVLWKIADALGVSISALLQADAAPPLLVLRHDQTAIYSSQEGHFRRRALFHSGGRRPFDFFEIFIGPGHAERLDLQPQGGEHSIVVSEGCVVATVGDEPPVRLNRGDAVVFRADVAVSLANDATASAIAFAVFARDT